MPSSDSQKLSSSKSPSKSLSSDSQNSIAYDSEFKGLPLTKETLVRHNEAMEKEFMQQHRFVLSSFFTFKLDKVNKKEGRHLFLIAGS